MLALKVLSLFVFTFSITSLCLVQQAYCDFVGKWFTTYDGPANDVDDRASITKDSEGNIYVVARSVGVGTKTDYTTIKYDANGNQLWAARYDGTPNLSEAVNDYPWSIAVDDFGNVFVTGESGVPGSVFGDIATVKYDSSGNALWVARYNGPGNKGDSGRNLVVDSSGNVYIVGRSYGDDTQDDFVTIKYGVNGEQLWVARYEGPDYHDRAEFIALDSAENVYVGGYSDDIDTYCDATVVKYNSSGDQLWVARNAGASLGDYYVQGLALDNNDNVYMAVQTEWNEGQGFGAIKLDANGNELWSNYYDSFYYYARPVVIGLDGQANVYVASFVENPYPDSVPYAQIVKYDTNGNQLWEYAETVDATVNIELKGGATDTAGNFYLVGYLEKSTGAHTNEFATIKYDAEGNKIWGKRLPGHVSSPTPMVIDDSGNIFVTSDRAPNRLQTGNVNTFAYSDPPTGLNVDFSSNIMSETPLTVAFADLSIDATAWNWDFDGDLVVDSTEQNPTYVYTLGGSYTVTLMVDTPEGPAFLSKRKYIESAGASILYMGKKRYRPREIVSIYGVGFGDDQGGSVVHLNGKIFDSTSVKMRSWQDGFVGFKLPSYKNKPCEWYKHGEGRFRRIKMWITVDDVDTDIVKIKIKKPPTCP